MQSTTSATSTAPRPGTSSMDACIEECRRCEAICLSTLQYCTSMGGAHASEAHIRALLDCIRCCATSAELMLRRSPLHPETCGVCASACRACAESCAATAGGDDVMAACADACRRCEASCRAMSTSHAH